MIEDFGIPVPGETVLILGAVYAGTGRLNIVLVALLGFVSTANMSSCCSGATAPVSTASIAVSSTPVPGTSHMACVCGRAYGMMCSVLVPAPSQRTATWYAPGDAGVSEQSVGALPAHRRALHRTAAVATWPGGSDMDRPNMHSVAVVARFQTIAPLAALMITCGMQVPVGTLHVRRESLRAETRSTTGCPTG